MCNYSQEHLEFVALGSVASIVDSKTNDNINQFFDDNISKDAFIKTEKKLIKEGYLNKNCFDFSHKNGLVCVNEKIGTPLTKKGREYYNKLKEKYDKFQK